MTATSSVITLLPQYVEVLGKKIDKIQNELDWHHKTLTLHPYSRMQDRLRQANTQPAKELLGLRSKQADGF